MTKLIRMIMALLMLLGGVGTIFVGLIYKDSLVMGLGAVIIFTIPMTMAAIEFQSKNKHKQETNW